MPFGILIYLLFDFLLTTPVMEIHLSSLGATGRNGFIQQCPAQPGKASPASLLFLSPAREVSSALQSHPGTGATLAKFLLPTPMCPDLFLLPPLSGVLGSPQKGWTSTKSLLFVGFCVSQKFSRFSLTWAGRHRGRRSGSHWFRSLCRSLSACYWMHRWARLLPGPLAYGTRSHNSHGGTFLHGWVPK